MSHKEKYTTLLHNVKLQGLFTDSINMFVIM